MKRREFLKNSALVMAGAAAAASGMVHTAFADEWTAKLKVLNPHEGQTLLAMTKQIFPHRGLNESCYIKVVEELDADAAKDPNVARLLREGVASLDRFAAASFSRLRADQQVAQLRKIDTGPFFRKVRGTELVSLYSNPVTWKQLGYQGPSFPYGGYAHRGFEDLKWLPDPPESASGKLA